jgi:hypothetical protein
MEKPRQITLVSSIAIVVTAVWVVFGGLFFGLFSCGGYVWHREFFYTVLLVLSVVIIAAPSKALQRPHHKMIAVVLLFVSFLTVQAVASTFYPGPPRSISEFSKEFIAGLIYGPCSKGKDMGATIHSNKRMQPDRLTAARFVDR